jgi:hypothetical protein
VNVRARLVKLVAMTVVISTACLGLSGIASAAKKGTPQWCASHPAKAAGVAACNSASSGSGSGGAGDPPDISVQIDPNPYVEVGAVGSLVVTVVQVEASPSFAGDAVNISSSQLAASCAGGIAFGDVQGGGTPAHLNFAVNDINAILDDDGNATVAMQGVFCAPGSDVVEADLTVAPYSTALGTLVVSPPAATASGVFGYPTYSGTVTTGEVETGDTTASGDSDIIADFLVEADPVYAEQVVEISSAELESRCGGGWAWYAIDPTPGPYPVSGTGANTGAPLSAYLDDDGNALFTFVGASCAAGSSEVIADVLAGSHPTYTTAFTITAPAPTI